MQNTNKFFDRSRGRLVTLVGNNGVTATGKLVFFNEEEAAVQTEDDLVIFIVEDLKSYEN